jgi:hypothetical protein
MTFHKLVPAKPVAGDAFEDVLYGSESELGESDNEQHAVRASGRPTRKGPVYGTRLRADDDEPMDLLEGVASHITSIPCNVIYRHHVSSICTDITSDRRRKPGQDATHFKTDRDTNKIIIDDPVFDNKMTDRQESDVAGTAYRESIISVDGFTRGPNGRVKFNKDTKKRRRDNEDIEDVEMVDGDINLGEGKKHKRRSAEKLGREFKAKASFRHTWTSSSHTEWFRTQKAGGDVKKGGVDPYAYLSLSQAAKMAGHRGRGRTGIIGKK